MRQVGRVLAAGLLALLPVGLSAQAKAGDYDPGNSKWDIFAGYSYLAPHGTTTTGVQSQAINFGSIVSISRYFNKYVGVQLEGQEHIPNQNAYYPHCPSCGSTWANDDFEGGSAGLVFRFPTEEVTPFVHGLVGADYVGVNPGTTSDVWGVLLTAGGGLDYATPLFHRHLSIRLFQADYQYNHINFPGGRGNFNMAQLSAGFVWHIGQLTPPPPITLACSASPAAVYPGDPVTVTGTAGMVLPKLTPTYTWTGTGVTGNGETATVATAGLAPGSYTVNGTVKEGTGTKPWETANCTASFTVKAYEPPTVSCSVTPTTIKPGDTATVTATGLSPQNRPLTYSYTTSSGTVTGTGTTATYASTGAATGPVTITGTVTDDKGQTATCQTSLTIEAPVAVAPKTQTLCSITFTKDTKRPTRVDNEAKACLDQVALSLQNQSDAKAVVVGEETSAEKEPKKGKHHHEEADYAAQRAVNTKAYLVEEKGIDASRISVATGTSDAQTVEDYLVPAGANFTSDVPSTTPVDESVVKPIKRTPLGAKPVHHHKKKM
jgi:hypothetical protein